MDKTDVNLRDTYKYYRKVSKGTYLVNDYLKICHLFMKFISKKVIEGHEVPLFGKLGFLSVEGTKRKIKFLENDLLNLAPDWVKTKQLWESNEQAKKDKKIVYQLNENTSGVRYKFLWSRKNVCIDTKNIYSLRMTRENKRAVSNEIKSGTEYYIKTFN